jgi:hypothetical protein
MLEAARPWLDSCRVLIAIFMVIACALVLFGGSLTSAKTHEVSISTEQNASSRT